MEKNLYHSAVLFSVASFETYMTRRELPSVYGNFFVRLKRDEVEYPL